MAGEISLHVWRIVAPLGTQHGWLTASARSSMAEARHETEPRKVEKQQLVATSECRFPEQEWRKGRRSNPASAGSPTAEDIRDPRLPLGKNKVPRATNAQGRCLLLRSFWRPG